MTEYVQAPLPGFEPPAPDPRRGPGRLRALLRRRTLHFDLDFPSLVVGCLGGALLTLALIVAFLWGRLP